MMPCCVVKKDGIILHVDPDSLRQTLTCAQVDALEANGYDVSVRCLAGLSFPPTDDAFAYTYGVGADGRPVTTLADMVAHQEALFPY
jgi:hypothetical protein